MDTVVNLDHAAGTPADERVIAAMTRAMRDAPANPSSAYGGAGRGRRLLREARKILSDGLGCEMQEIFFTSGGSEGNAWALRQAAGKRVALSALEHASVFNAASLWGCRVDVIPADSCGVIRPEAVRRVLTPDVALLSVQYANNETGVLQPVEEIGRVARELHVPFHTDAVQAFGHVPVRVSCCDMATFSAHKLYGPRGVGAFYARQGFPLLPLIPGGGQERGFRGGTENVPGVCGFGVAAELALETLSREARREEALLEPFCQALCRLFPGARVLGEGAPRLPGIRAVYFPGLLAERVVAVLDLRGIWISGASACASRERKASRVYRALGLTEEEALCVVRFSIGRETTGEMLTRVLEEMKRVGEG